MAPRFSENAIFLFSHVGITFTLNMNPLIYGKSLLKGLNKLWLIVFD